MIHSLADAKDIVNKVSEELVEENQQEKIEEVRVGLSRLVETKKQESDFQ
jgi:hypothetical protein